jgi:hypothetical protein
VEEGEDLAVWGSVAVEVGATEVVVVVAAVGK